jgi:hypothetical protein
MRDDGGKGAGARPRAEGREQLKGTGGGNRAGHGRYAREAGGGNRADGLRHHVRQSGLEVRSLGRGQ